MKIAIHRADDSDAFEGDFSSAWIKFCQKKTLPYKLVNSYASDIISQVSDCDVFMWHFSHAHHIDCQLAINLIQAIEASGKIVFPNSASCWHFNNKIAQKYLLEAINAPFIPTYVAWDRDSAKNMALPSVVKLKGGAGSANVKLVSTKRELNRYVSKSFRGGFRQFDRFFLFRRSFKQLLAGKSDVRQVVKSFAKIFVKSDFEKIEGPEVGYVLAQKFLANNAFDTRVIVIGKKAIGILRHNSEGDFRASGSGLIEYDEENIDIRCVQISFDVCEALEANCLAFDFLFDEDGSPLIAEISYGFSADAYASCPGYWGVDLGWHTCNVEPQNWMIESLLKDG